MSKEIKFAFWHKRKKEMWHVESIDWRIKEVSNGGDVASLDDGDLLQFTGLKDKNGKEIFEGNIVNAQYNISSFFKKVCVYFENGCFYVDDKNPKQNLSIGYFFREKKEIEVIGNIYQNPELLGGEND
jgi:uncharacterized phage protein (TIGR01671 family)